MKILSIIVLIFSQALFADFCMCVYPEKGNLYGKDDETGFYRLGCGIWLNSQKSCRKRKLMTLGSSLEDFIEENATEGEVIKLGYVGHSNLEGMKTYLKNYLSPLIEKTSHSFIIDNTACDGLKDPSIIHRIVKNYQLDPKQYIRIKANQVVSVGVWDKVYPRFRNANLYAISDSRSDKIEYPSCRKYWGSGCSATFQHNEKGLCQYKGKLSKVVCTNKLVTDAKVAAHSRLHKLLGNFWLPDLAVK